MSPSVSTAETAVERRVALQESRLEQLARMIEIRNVEENVQTLYNDGHIRGSTHLANGQEAVSVGIAAVARPTDIVTCTYRGHGTALALGVTPEAVLGEICGRSIGCVGGIGGSMHLGDLSVGLFPTFAIVGAGVPVAAGAAMSAWVARHRRRRHRHLRRRLDEHRRLPRRAEPRRHPQAARRLRVREQPLRGVHPHQPVDAGGEHRRPRRFLRDARDPRRRPRRRRRDRRRRHRANAPAAATVRRCSR